MEELLFCFGGGGGEGGGSDSSPGPSTGSTHPGQPGGSAGERGPSTGADRGGATGGSTGGSRGDAFDMSGGYVDQAISNFASPSVGVMSTPMQAARGQSGFGGSGGGGGFGGPSPGAAGAGSNNYGFNVSPIGSPSFPQAPDFSSPGAANNRAAIAAGAGVSPDTIVGSGPGGINAVMSASGPVTSGRSVAAEAARQGTTVADIQGRISDAAAGLSSRAATDAALDSALDPTSTFDAFDLSKAYADQAISDFDAQTRAMTPAQGIVSAARAPADIASVAETISRDDQAIADVQARNAVRGATDITSGQVSGTVDRDTTITPSNLDNPFGDSIFDSEEANAADLADMTARGNMTASQLAAVAPGTPAAAMVDEARSSALGGPTPGSMTVSTPVTGTPAADITVTYGADDLAREKANLEAAKDAAYSDKQFGFDTGLPESVDLGFATFPTGIGIAERFGDTMLNPKATVANAISEIGIATVNGESAEGTANYNPQGLDVVTAGGPVTEGGRTAAYDPNTNIVYDTPNILEHFGNAITRNVPPDIQALYDRKNAIDDAARQRGDRDDVLLFPDRGLGGLGGGGGGGGSSAPEDYQGRNIVGEATGYRPRGPINYAYTGLPSLAPVAIRPSFRARGQYSPLFPVG